MAADLVPLALQVLTPEVISRAGTALGLDRGAAQNAISAAVPGLMGLLATEASRPAGAKRLFDAVSAQDPGLLDRLERTLAGAERKTLQETGSSLLFSLIGGDRLNALSSAVAKFAGLAEGAGRALLGLVAPVVLGVLGQAQRNAGLDANGLANLLTSQQDEIARAMPPGFARLLSSAGLFDAVAAERTAAATSRTTAGLGQRARSAASRAASSAWAPWLTGLVGLAALLVLLWYLAQGKPAAAQDASTAIQAIPPAGLIAASPPAMNPLAGKSLAIPDAADGAKPAARSIRQD